MSTDRIVPVPCRWAKGQQGKFLVYGPAGLAGHRVMVHSVQGTGRVVRLGTCVTEYPRKGALYTVASDVLSTHRGDVRRQTPPLSNEKRS